LQSIVNEMALYESEIAPYHAKSFAVVSSSLLNLLLSVHIINGAARAALDCQSTPPVTNTALSAPEEALAILQTHRIWMAVGDLWGWAAE